MKIEVSRLNKVEAKEGNPLRAYADIAFVDGEDFKFVVKGLTVKEKQDGTKLYVSMPQKKGKADDKGNEWHDVAMPVTSATRQMIETAVLEEYNK